MNEEKQVLNVFYNSKIVGYLSEDNEERLSFCYSKKWLEDDDSFSLSLALSLSSETYGHLITKSFFENLLPEGEVKNILEKSNKKNISDEFSFLKEYGVDCSGAFVITSLDHVSQVKKFKSKQISLDSIYEYLDNKQSLTSVMINEEGGRFSLAGAQDKFPVIYKKNKILLPLNGEPTTHILKPYVRYHKDTMDSPYNEYFCMKLAKAIGLNIPKVTLIDGKYPIYLIERFDRAIVNSNIIRIHQQDFCQAKGITSRKKYEEDGGPTITQNYELIKKFSSLPIKDLSQFLNWFWFNLLIGNNDCHSKNLSFVHTNNGIRLSPFYDLLSTVIYKELTNKFSYSIGGQWKWHDLKLRNFTILAESLGVDVSLIFKSGKEVIKKLEKKLDIEVLSFESQFEDVLTAKKIEEEINKRVKHIQSKIKELS